MKLLFVEIVGLKTSTATRSVMRELLFMVVLIGVLPGADADHCCAGTYLIDRTGFCNCPCDDCPSCPAGKYMDQISTDWFGSDDSTSEWVIFVCVEYISP